MGRVQAVDIWALYLNSVIVCRYLFIFVGPGKCRRVLPTIPRKNWTIPGTKRRNRSGMVYPLAAWIVHHRWGIRERYEKATKGDCGSKPLKKHSYYAQTDRAFFSFSCIHFEGIGTGLSFNIASIPSIPCTCPFIIEWPGTCVGFSSSPCGGFTECCPVLSFLFHSSAQALFNDQQPLIPTIVSPIPTIAT